MLKNKSKPLRKCISCNERKIKEDFIMVVRSPKKESQKNFSLMDGIKKKEGRAAYICKNSNCIKNTIRFKKLEKAFKQKINSEIYENLEKAELIYE